MDDIVQELTNETVVKEYLERWLDKTDINKKEAGVDILFKEYPVFKLKKKKIKNKKYNLIKNTKVYFFLFKNCIPKFADFNIPDSANKDDGFSWNIDITFSAENLSSRPNKAQ